MVTAPVHRVGGYQAAVRAVDPQMVATRPRPHGDVPLSSEFPQVGLVFFHWLTPIPSTKLAVLTVYHAVRERPRLMPARRKIGAIERAVRRDLRTFPDTIAAGTVAQAMLTLAAEADTRTLEPRDLAQLLRELRLCSVQLRDMAPPGAEGDKIDELRKRRETRLLREHGGQA